ncbi:hypothetical protein ATO67_20005 [Agrobacterium bohemicum]|uniref:Uncharacterized protein n=1 Tax=Agrobacterium bohemicum TaxID=2052828 RepID=A0A135P788_9HYPH|nr:hypothetical protein ATO67_20005 [Agrobacterium bohemicum]
MLRPFAAISCRTQPRTYSTCYKCRWALNRVFLNFVRSIGQFYWHYPGAEKFRSGRAEYFALDLLPSADLAFCLAI